MTFRSTLKAAAMMAALSTSMLATAALAGPFQQGEDGTGVGISLTPASQPLDFVAYLPLHNEAALDKLIAAQAMPGSDSYHKWLTPAQFDAAYGPSPAQLKAAVKGFQALGMKAEISGPRQVHVAGTAAQVQSAFAVQLRTVKGKGGTSRVLAGGALSLSPALKAVGVMIPEFANTPLLQPKGAVVTDSVPDNRYGNSVNYYFTDLKQAYDYPAYTAMRNGKRVDGTGASVAILMSGKALQSDVEGVFNHEAWTANTDTPIPTFNVLQVRGGAPAFPGGAAVESTLDVQTVLGGAPGSDTTLVEIPTLSNANIAAGYAAIVQSNTYDIVNSSFGGPEEYYLPGYNGGTDYTYLLKIEDGLFKQGNAQGITFIVSSGDEGALQSPGLSYFNPDPLARAIYVPSVSTPASSPHVTAVGGGNLVTTFDPTNFANTQSSYIGENGFGDALVPQDPYAVGKLASGGYWGAGGGISQVFGKPLYQQLVPTGTTRYRTLPDVGMLVGGCPGSSIQPCGPDRSYVVVYYDGRRAGLIGTSHSAPEFAGALALYVGQNGRVGNANDFLYAAAKAQASGGAAAFHTAHPSYDGYWRDGDQGGAYDYIFGNGSPDVRVLFGFTDLEPAGDPKSPTNP